VCRSISPVIRLPLEDNCDRTFLIFSFFNLNILHAQIEGIFLKILKKLYFDGFQFFL